MTYARSAIVTGADSGIGAATATLLATEGFDVAITFHSDEAGARDTAAEVERRGQKAYVEQWDASTPDAGDVVDRFVEQLGGLGVLVNVAGTGHAAPVADTSYEQWRDVLATDLDGPFLTCRRAAAHLVGPVVAAGSSTSPASTSTCRGSARRRTARRRPGSAP